MNLVLLLASISGWMISVGIISCILGFTALAEAKDTDAFKVCAVLLLALGVPMGLASMYVHKRVTTLMDGDTIYMRHKDALFDVLVCTGALLIMVGFLFMVIGFTVNTSPTYLQYLGITGTVQFVVGMLDLVFIRVWVRGSQPRTGRGNIIDVILDLKYPIAAFENTLYASEGQPSPEPVTYEQDIGEPQITIENLGGPVSDVVATYLPAAPPTYAHAVGTTTPSGNTRTTDETQFEPPPAYQLTAD